MLQPLGALRRFVPDSVSTIVLGFILSQPLLGRFAPELFTHLHEGGFKTLSTIAQCGLAVFLLGVGMHFDKKAVLQSLSNHCFRAVTVSSLLFPGLAGFVFGYLLFSQHPEYAARSGSAKFGIVNAIIFATAAVPVLCAILQRLGVGVLRSYRETIVIAMISDVVLWMTLGLLANESALGTFKAIGGLGIIIGLGFTVGTKVLEEAETLILSLEKHGVSKQLQYALFFLLALVTLTLCAGATNWVGAHTLPGAFLAGLLIPDQMKDWLLYGPEQTRDRAGHLCPNSGIDRLAKYPMMLFFLLPGLRFAGDLWQPTVWELGALYTVCAAASKMASVFLPALFVAQVSVKRALKMSFLLNTRGTMEIVAVSELYKLALLSIEIFLAVIIMTIVNTAMTVPGVRLVWRRYPQEEIRVTAPQGA